jgi:hypothetical protein
MSGHHLERIGRKIDALEKQLRSAHDQDIESMTTAELGSLDATGALADLAHCHRRNDHGGGDDRLFYVSAPDGGCGFNGVRSRNAIADRNRLLRAWRWMRATR